ncbi:hypothetical protein BH23CHL5_BH23CHL5_05550 [soil metagenome]
MIRPRISIQTPLGVVSIALVDSLVVAMFGWFVLGNVEPLSTSPAYRSGSTLIVLAGFLFVGWFVETFKRVVSGDPSIDEPVLLTLFGGVRSSGSQYAVKNQGVSAGLRGIVVNLVFGTGMFAMAIVSTEQWETSLRSSLVFVIGGLAGSMACLRLCPVAGLDGGMVATRVASLVCEDVESADQLVRTMGIATGLLASVCGFLMFAEPGPMVIWGFPLLAAGVGMIGLSQWFFVRSRWARLAGQTALADLGRSKLPSVRCSSPISELFSIFAVEGQRALVVVTDETGRPTGLIQLRQLRAAHGVERLHPDELMVTLSKVPAFDGKTTVLEAALALERSGQRALVVKSDAGRQRVVSLEELEGIVD